MKLTQYSRYTIHSILLACTFFMAGIQTAQAKGFLLSGYGYFNYESSSADSGLKLVASPLLLYQPMEKMLVEAEFELEDEQSAGNTVVNTNVEYLTIDYSLGNTLNLVAGKFLSPTGQFVQNYHPAWINKLPIAPPGFGHDGAAPRADVGIQLKGVIPTPSWRSSYSFYVGNGPELEAVAGEIHGINTSGSVNNDDGEYVAGGRYALRLGTQAELGVSMATGKAAVSGETGRAYQVTGVDLIYQRQALDIRAEAIQQTIDPLIGSSAPEGGTWQSAYLQAAYRILPTNWEVMIRYGDFQSPHPEQEQQQTMVGANYLFHESWGIKLAYAFNQGQAGSGNELDTMYVQMYYGI
jgi:hypothetical protein